MSGHLVTALNVGPLVLAECRLAFGGKDFGDALALHALDLVIGVEQGKAEPLRHRPADCRLPCAHEADEVEIHVCRVHQTAKATLWADECQSRKNVRTAVFPLPLELCRLCRQSHATLLPAITLLGSAQKPGPACNTP